VKRAKVGHCPAYIITAPNDSPEMAEVEVFNFHSHTHVELLASRRPSAIAREFVHWRLERDAQPDGIVRQAHDAMWGTNDSGLITIAYVSEQGNAFRAAADTISGGCGSGILLSSHSRLSFSITARQKLVRRTEQEEMSSLCSGDNVLCFVDGMDTKKELPKHSFNPREYFPSGGYMQRMCRHDSTSGTTTLRLVKSRQASEVYFLAFATPRQIETYGQRGVYGIYVDATHNADRSVPPLK
jgi:hypothetical protein